MRADLLACAVLLLLSEAAWGYCGLEVCPADPPSEEAARRVTGSVDVRRTSFDYFHLPGRYTEVLPRVEIAAGRLRAAAVMPMVTLSFLGETRTGLGNPSFALESALAGGDRAGLTGGVLWEAPLGDSDQGLADDHSMLMPYLRGDLSTAPLRFQASAAYRFAVSDEESDGAAAAPRVAGGVELARLALHAGHSHALPDVVNPHEDREIVWRAEASAARALLGVHPSLHLGGEHVVQSDVEEDFFLEGGAGLLIPLGSRIGMDARGSVPLSAAERYEWRFGASLRLR